MNTRSIRFLLGATIALVIALLLLVSPRPVRAAPKGSTFIVNSAVDEPNSTLVSPVCSSAPSAVCTLRAAIMAANANPGDDTIIVPAGTFSITRTGFDDMAVFGDLDITDSVNIQGAGSAATIIDGNGSVTNDRVFQVLLSTYAVTMTGMTIRNGNATTLTNPSGLGGGIYHETCGICGWELHLDDVILEGNAAQNGAGIYATGSTLTLNNTVLRANVVPVWGGGMYANSADLLIQNSQVYSNVGYFGGGIYAYQGSVTLKNTQMFANKGVYGGGSLAAQYSLLAIQDSRVYSSTAPNGGGLDLEDTYDGHILRTEIYSNTAVGGGGAFLLEHSPSKVTFLDSYLHNNRADSYGGAIANSSSLVISRTVLDSNSAGTRGGGLDDQGVAGTTAITIDASTLSNNGAQFGGGIAYFDMYPQSKMVIVNSTLSGNSAARPFGGAGSSDGGGIYAYDGGQIWIYNATIANNNANPGFGLQTHLARGGGLLITTTAVITMVNSLLANNTRSNGISIGTSDDCFTNSATTFLHSSGYNLIQNTTNCLIVGTTTGNVIGQDPVLAPLYNNGGSTKTHALLSGSPAIDAGNPSGCKDNNGVTLTIDQRRGRRPTNGTCDVGAYEYGGLLFLHLPLIFR